MRTFLIIYSPTNNIAELQARIRSIGDAFFFMNNHCLLSVQDDNMTAEDVFNRLGDDSQLYSIYVTTVSTTVREGYWGTMSRDFWEWLAAHPKTA